MPIYRLLQRSAFDPDLKEAMTAAFEDACSELRLAKRDDPLRDVVAKRLSHAPKKASATLQN